MCVCVCIMHMGVERERKRNVGVSTCGVVRPSLIELWDKANYSSSGEQHTHTYTYMQSINQWMSIEYIKLPYNVHCLHKCFICRSRTCSMFFLDDKQLSKLLPLDRRSEDLACYACSASIKKLRWSSIRAFFQICSALGATWCPLAVSARLGAWSAHRPWWGQLDRLGRRILILHSLR